MIQNDCIHTSDLAAWIAKSVKRQGYGLKIAFRFLTGSREIPLLLNVQTGTGTHPTSHSMRTDALSSGRKRSVGEAYDSFLTSLLVTRFKISGTLPPFFNMLLGWNYFSFTSSQLVEEVTSFT